MSTVRCVLKGCRHWTTLTTWRTERFTEQGDTVVFESEVDKMYLDAPLKIAIIDHEKKRTFSFVKKDGLLGAVVWNPWRRNRRTRKILGMKIRSACCLWHLQLLRKLLPWSLVRSGKEGWSCQLFPPVTVVGSQIQTRFFRVDYLTCHIFYRNT